MLMPIPSFGYLPLAEAQSRRAPNKTRSLNLSSLQLNGDAILTAAKQLLLTQGGTEQVGSAFIRTPFSFGPTSRLEIAFAYEAYGSSTKMPADGLALVLQGAGPSYLGLSGSGLGLFNQAGIPAIGVTVDYFPNSINGSVANTLAVTTGFGTDLVQTQPTLSVYGAIGGSRIRFLWVEYDNSINLMNVYYSGVSLRPQWPMLTLSLPQDISSLFRGRLFIGVSASTGEADCVQSISFLSARVSE